MRFAAVAGVAVDLRWPNDLLIGPRKAGGILVEAKIESTEPLLMQWWASGSTCISAALLADLATPATSLDLEAGARVSRQALLVALLKSLEREAAGLADADAHAQHSGARGAGFNLGAGTQGRSARTAGLHRALPRDWMKMDFCACRLQRGW